MAAAPGKTRGYYVPLAIKTISLIAIYATYGLLQERIIKGHYKDAQDGTSDETFESPPLLVFCNRVVSLATGLVLAQIQPPALSLPTTTSLPLQETWAQKLSAIATRIRPASPFIYYGLIAVLNNAATLSQYGSLSYLSFTTSTLGKSAKMVPVLIIGQLWYGKKYRLRQRVGVVIVILGIWGYLNSLPKAAVGRDGHMTGSTTNWVGVLYLLTYLFFDGMTSTMQERLFGQEKAGQEPFTLMGITGGIIDQMIWVNLFSSIIALCTMLVSPSDSTLSSIKLVLATPTLQLHILLLSATATAGLLVLLHVIATYGALMASLVMTVRQFVSIVCNAVWFGTATKIPLVGWAGIGIMAAGIWIKIDRRYDDTNAEEKAALESKGPLNKASSFALQYLLPLFICPASFVLLIATIEATR